MSSPLPLFALLTVAACAPVAPQETPPQAPAPNAADAAAEAARNGSPRVKVGAEDCGPTDCASCDGNCGR